MYKKFLYTLLMGISLATAFPAVQAVDLSAAQDSNLTPDGNSIVSPCADKIVIKYRILNGKKQYRRWNETKHCWVDSHWINY